MWAKQDTGVIPTSSFQSAVRPCAASAGLHWPWWTEASSCPAERASEWQCGEPVSHQGAVRLPLWPLILYFCEMESSQEEPLRGIMDLLLEGFVTICFPFTLRFSRFSVDGSCNYWFSVSIMGTEIWTRGDKVKCLNVAVRYRAERKGKGGNPDGLARHGLMTLLSLSFQGLNPRARTARSYEIPKKATEPAPYMNSHSLQMLANNWIWRSALSELNWIFGGLELILWGPDLGFMFCFSDFQAFDHYFGKQLFT